MPDVSDSLKMLVIVGRRDFNVFVEKLTWDRINHGCLGDSLKYNVSNK